MALAAVAMLVGAAAVHADNNGKGEGEGAGNVTSNIVTPPTLISPEGENYGSVVSDVARGLGVPGIAGQQQTQPSVSLDMNGNFSVTGVTVQSVDAAANTVTVSLFGFTRTVSLAGATITGGGQTIGVGTIQTGDILSGRGAFNISTHAITVASVVDLSTQNANAANIQAQINHLMQLLQQLEVQAGMNVSTTTSSN